MSIWKNKSVKIIQIVTNPDMLEIVGLGDDGCVYIWQHIDCAWKKYWWQDDELKGNS